MIEFEQAAALLQYRRPVRLRLVLGNADLHAQMIAFVQQGLQPRTSWEWLSDHVAPLVSLTYGIGATTTLYQPFSAGPARTRGGSRSAAFAGLSNRRPGPALEVIEAQNNRDASRASLQHGARFGRMMRVRTR
jgi:hypothetical protein